MALKEVSTHKALRWLQRQNCKKYAEKPSTPTYSKRLTSLLKNQKSITLYSIKPQYSNLIFCGKKTIELRKKLPKTKNRLIAVYETAPTKKVIGLCEVSNYYELPIKKIHNFIKNAQIEKKFLLSYYKNKKQFAAIEIANYFKFKKPLNLEDFSGERKVCAPQSFYYVINFNLSLILNML
ncbi:MAG: ASCH domain-containing protein [Nanoarchaeota archaeon]